MNRQQQFKYKEAKITADRLGEDFFIDVRSLIVELVFFENLEKPYISGQVAITDDQGAFDSITFSGTERLEIQMLTELASSESEAVVMDRSFILTGIDTIVKSSNSGTSSIYVFSFMDEHAFVSKTKHVSRAIRDPIDIEILKLIQNELARNVDLSYAGKVAQNNYKGIIPYMHPLEAASWLTEKITTPLGMPFFLYASIHDTNLRFGSLDKMLEEPAWNESVPYIFSPSNTQKQEESGDPTKQYFQVQSMKSTKLQNTMKQLMSGGIGSQYSVTDINNGRTTANHFDLFASLGRANAEGLIDLGKQNIYDNLYKTYADDRVNIESQYLHDTDAVIFHNIVSRGVYSDKKSLHEESSPEMYLRKVENLAYRNALYKNMFDVTLPGPGFIASNGSVGDIIRIEVLGDVNDPDADQPLDALRSGDFIVYNTRHTFKDTRHDVAMTVCKLERGPAV
jgi:hypothetical protein